MAERIRRRITKPGELEAKREAEAAAVVAAVREVSTVSRRVPTISLVDFDFMQLSDLEQQELQYYDQWYRKNVHKSTYPWDAPGMPMPGPNFLRHAQDQGDSSLLESSKVSYLDGDKKRQKTVQQVKIGPVLSNLMSRALRDPSFTMPVQVRGSVLRPVQFVPGHIWGQGAATLAGASPQMIDGPHPAEVMVVGKMPWKDELKWRRNLMGASGEVLVRILSELKVPDVKSWYVTNILKFMPPDNTTRIAADWLKDCLPLLYQELRLVRPKLILCLGADASKVVLGKQFSVSYMEGRVVEHTYPVTLTEHCEITNTALVMTVVHPAQVTRDESQKRTLARGIARFNLLLQGKRFDQVEEDIDHRTISDLVELGRVLKEVEQDPEKKDDWIGMDAEWQGLHAVNEGSYLRTVQFAWKPKHAIVLKLREAGGDYAMQDHHGQASAQTERVALQMLKVFLLGGKIGSMTFRPKRIAGHFFNSDLEWLVHNGLDIRPAVEVPLWDILFDEVVNPKHQLVYRQLGYGPGKTIPAWVRTKCEGGFDTALAVHAIEETALLGLETLAIRYTTAPRWDIQLEDWKGEYCKAHKLKRKQLEGYGDCPDHILCPTPQQRLEYGTHNYAAYDPDVTLRLVYELEPLLDCDYENNNCREAFWESMAAMAALYEINTTGVMLDTERLDFLTDAFVEGQKSLLGDIQGYLKWEDFNPRSLGQVREFLYGEQLNRVKTKDGSIKRLRPVEADNSTLDLVPLTDTSKPPRQWADLVRQNKADEATPATGKITLSILANENPDVAEPIRMVRDFRFLDKAVSSVLSPKDPHGRYKSGLGSFVCSDQRVRTYLINTAETGRGKSRRPNLQNITKGRDKDYRRLLKEKYKYKLRSMFMAAPGHCLVEADYAGAELFGMAVMSGDANMINHATRTQLPEGHDDYYDIHSNVAKLAFQLDCEPTKKGLDLCDAILAERAGEVTGIRDGKIYVGKIGHSYRTDQPVRVKLGQEIKLGEPLAGGKEFLRGIAKTVVFGIAYGRGAKAIAFAAREQGIQITEEEAQAVIDAIFTMYPGLIPFFQECEQRAVTERWLCHCYGRYRRFPLTMDESIQGEFQRQAKNFPIQGMIASAVNRALAYLNWYRKENQHLFKILLQIHDAVLLEVPYEHVEFVAENVMPWAMRDMVPIYPTTMSGIPTGRGPFYLGFEAECFEHWGEKIDATRAAEIGLSRSKYSRDGVVVKYFQAA